MPGEFRTRAGGSRARARRRRRERRRHQARGPQPAEQERAEIVHLADQAARHRLLDPAGVGVPAAGEAGVGERERREARHADSR